MVLDPLLFVHMITVYFQMVVNGESMSGVNNKAIFIKLASNRQCGKGFLLTSRFCIQAVVFSFPGIINVYDSIPYIYIRNMCQVSPDPYLEIL